MQQGHPPRSPLPFQNHGTRAPAAAAASATHLLPLGLAHARMEVRALSVDTRPALATLTVCCSITWGGGGGGCRGGVCGGVEPSWCGKREARKQRRGRAVEAVFCARDRRAVCRTQGCPCALPTPTHPVQQGARPVAHLVNLVDAAYALAAQPSPTQTPCRQGATTRRHPKNTPSRLTSCSMARAPSLILSNSSMQHMPLSLSTRAPLSSTISLVSGSCGEGAGSRDCQVGPGIWRALFFGGLKVTVGRGRNISRSSKHLRRTFVT